MKQNKLFLGLATMFAAAFTFTACSSDDAESQSVQQDRTIRLTSSVERGSTRATSDPQSGTSLSTSSSLGVIAINSSSETLTNGDNELYSVDGSNLNPTTTANKMTWPASGNVSFYAYAPYADGTTYNSANSFSVKTDQTTEANYLASDLVLAKNENVAKTESAVELSFNHLMAKINITIQKATNATVDLSNAKVSIINTQPTCTFKPNATGTGEDKVLGAASGDVTEITLVSALGTATTACGIIVPQTLAANTGLVKIQTAPGTANNRILIAKLSAETTFASGQQYSFTVTINDPTAPVTYITLKAGSANLVAWENNALGASTKEFSLGDYILKDGSLLKANDPDFATKKTNIIAVIFSNQVSSTDAEAGYDAYAMGVSRIGAGGGTKKQWYVNTSYNLGAANLADGFADLDGRTKCATIKASDTYTNLGTKTEHIANLDNYSLAIDAGAIVGSETEGNRNLSGWFTPSFGQLIAILNNLGDAGITSGIAKEFKNNSSFYINSDNTTWANTEQGGITISTVLDKINAYTSTAGKGNILTLGNVDLGTVTENTSGSANGQKFWMFTLKSGGDWELTAAQAKVGGSGVKEVCVIPVVAVKLPPVAE